MTDSSQDLVAQRLLERAAAQPLRRAAVLCCTGRESIESAVQAESKGLIRATLLVPRVAAERVQSLIVGHEHAVRWCDDETSAIELGAELAVRGETDLLIKGDVHTDDILRTLIARRYRLLMHGGISHVFHMSLPGRARGLAVADAAVNVAPSVAKRVTIAGHMVRALRAAGIDRPKIAVLSATEVVSAAMPSSVEALEIVERCRVAYGETYRGAVFDGPLALDLALSPGAAASKGYTGQIRGDADGVLVPNIETGNALFKALVHFQGATAAGVVQGLRIPLVVTSRSDSAFSRLASIALAALVATPQ